MGNIEIDFAVYWTWFLLFIRMGALFSALPGIGTDQVPERFRLMPAITIAACVALGGVRAHTPATLAEGGLMMGSELALGYILGFIPQLVLGGLTVAGQIIAGSVGLAQANMIDHSLGESVSIISRLKAQIGVLVFLFMDGHHIVIRAASGIASDVGIGMFRPGADTFAILLERFVSAFHLSIVISAPIIVSALLTQFVLGLVTKFVPQVNIFIISLPLSIIAGLYIIEVTFPGLVYHVEHEFKFLEEALARVFASSDIPAAITQQP